MTHRALTLSMRIATSYSHVSVFIIHSFKSTGFCIDFVPADSRLVLVMDWIFGVGNKNKNDPQNISQLLGAALPPGGDDPNKNSQAGAAAGAATGAQTAYRFDSTALERAAAAAKELEKSSMVLLFILAL